jgi:hypothetical protein
MIYVNNDVAHEVEAKNAFRQNLRQRLTLAYFSKVFFSTVSCPMMILVRKYSATKTKGMNNDVVSPNFHW